MKKLLYIALSLVAATFVACDEDIVVGEVDLGYLKLIESNVNFDYHGGSGTILVDTDLSITATVAPDAEGTTWATASVQGNTVTVTVPVNTVPESRHTSVTLKAGDRSVVVPVSQTSYALQLSSESLSFSKQEGSKTVTYTPADVPVVIESDQPWVSATVDQANASIIVTVEGNPGNARTATISIVSGVQSASISVSQDSALSVTAKVLSFTAPAGSQTVQMDVTDGVEVTAVSSEDWATAVVDLAAKKVTVNVTANMSLTQSRTATVTLSAGTGDATVSADITVNQAAITFVEWANVSFTTGSAFLQTPPINKAIKLVKADGFNIFQFQGPFVANYNFIFQWDIDNKATAISPVGSSWTLSGIPVIAQNVGVSYTPAPGSYIYAMTDPDPGYTFYNPETKTFTVNSYYGVIDGSNTFLGGYGWTDDTFVITEFLKGNPWE